MKILTLVLVLLGFILILSSPLVFAGIAYLLAQKNKFLTAIDEGRTKAKMVNKRFKGFFLSYADHKFRGNTDLLSEELDPKNRKWVYQREKPANMDGWEESKQFQIQTSGSHVGELRKLKMYRRKETDSEVRARIDPHPWDVVKGKQEVSPLSEIILIGSWLANIYWLGIYPFAQVHKKHQRWVSWDYPHGENDSVEAEKKPIPHNEEVDYLLVQEDVYWAKVSGPETWEGIPVNVYILLTARVCNPYKAWFRVQNWVEAVTNQIEADTRELTGQLKFNQLFRGRAASSEMLNEKALQELTRFRSVYGIEVTLVQIQSVDPAGPRGERYRELSTKKYEADQEAEARKIAAEAEEIYIKKTQGTVAEIEKDLKRSLGEAGYRNLKLSQLTGTLVESGSNALVSVSAQGSSKKQDPKRKDPDNKKKPV